jgi:hypothetical protein
VLRKGEKLLDKGKGKMRLNRILENRIFSIRGDIYKTFEKKIVDSFYLERKIMMMKFGKRELSQSRVQHVVFLVSCLEYFLEEIFKLSFDKGLFSLQDINKSKSKNLNSIKMNLDELKKINDNKIKLSEILAEEMNFQNINDIVLLCDLLKIEKNFRKISSQKRKTKLPVFKGKMPPLRKDISSTAEKTIAKFVVENFGNNFALPKDQEKLIRTINTVHKMISLRHKIVHKGHVVKIDNWESFAYTMVTVQLAFFVSECYKIELKRKIKKLNPR